MNVTFHAMIGRDRYGESIKRTFVAEPATFLHDIDPNGTERHVNLMNADGERISIFVVEATPEPDIDYGRLNDLVETSEALLINPVDYTRPLLSAAERYDTPIWCDVHAYDGEDPHFDAFVEAADYLFMSEEGIDDPSGFMHERVEAGTDLVVCTQGVDGSTALTNDGTWIETPAEPGRHEWRRRRLRFGIPPWTRAGKGRRDLYATGDARGRPRRRLLRARAPGSLG